jgi:hypothetical protein
MSSWNFYLPEYDNKFMEMRHKRERNLFNRVLPAEKSLETANICFDNCVKDFTSISLSNEESKCLYNCKEMSYNYFFENK